MSDSDFAHGVDIPTSDSAAYKELFLHPQRDHQFPSLAGVASEDEVKLIKAWLKFCTDDHHECANRDLQHFSDSEPILLIDTARLCIIDGRTSYRYVALSYVW